MPGSLQGPNYKVCPDLTGDHEAVEIVTFMTSISPMAMGFVLEALFRALFKGVCSQFAENLSLTGPSSGTCC